MGNQKKFRLSKTSALVALFVVALVMGVVFGVGRRSALSGSEQKKANSNASVSANYDIKNACEEVSLEEAKQSLGSATVKGELGDSSSASSADIELSKCLYLDSEKTSTFTGDTMGKELSIVVRSPKNESGASANQKVFEVSSLPTGSEVVTGVGDKAFWNAEFGQLNILDESMWYTIEFGPKKPEARTLEVSKRVAQEIL